MSNKAMNKDYLLRQFQAFEGDVLAQKSIATEEGYHNFRYYNEKFSYKDGNTWTDIGYIIPLTQQQYNNLSTADKNKNVLYYITDSQSSSGGLFAGTGISIVNDEISVKTASASQLGGIKVGSNLSIDGNGVLSADAQSVTVDDELDNTSNNPVKNSVITAIFADKADKVESATNGDVAKLDSNGNLVDSGISASDLVIKSSTGGLLKNDGTVDTTTYLSSIPTASTSALGGVKVDGTTVTINSSGVISASGGSGVPDGGTTGQVLAKKSNTDGDADWIDPQIVPSGYTSNPAMNGTASPGSSDKFAKGDHVHPSDTAKLSTTGDGSNVTAAFTAASSRANISTGEKLSVIFGKIAKFFADLKTVAFSGSYNDLSNKLTAGTNIAISGANVISTTSTYTMRYSTSEQVVGIWIDGKPVYQKVVNFGSGPNNTTKNIAHGISNIKTLVDIRTVGVSGSGSSLVGFTINSSYYNKTDNQNNIVCYLYGSDIYIMSTNDQTGTNYYTILKYTKTTDT